MRIDIAIFYIRNNILNLRIISNNGILIIENVKKYNRTDLMFYLKNCNPYIYEDELDFYGF